MKTENIVSVDSLETPIKTFIPFTGAEKKCWFCGGDRELVIRLDVDGNLDSFDEVCDGGKQVDGYECPGCGKLFLSKREGKKHWKAEWKALSDDQKQVIWQRMQMN